MNFFFSPSWNRHHVVAHAAAVSRRSCFILRTFFSFLLPQRNGLFAIYVSLWNRIKPYSPHSFSSWGRFHSPVSCRETQDDVCATSFPVSPHLSCYRNFSFSQQTTVPRTTAASHSKNVGCYRTTDFHIFQKSWASPCWSFFCKACRSGGGRGLRQYGWMIIGISLSLFVKHITIVWLNMKYKVMFIHSLTRTDNLKLYWLQIPGKINWASKCANLFYGWVCLVKKPGR